VAPALDRARAAQSLLSVALAVQLVRVALLL
jgi:hypothetical protein